MAEGFNMGIILEERLSDSPFIERVWRSSSDDISSFMSVATFTWDFVVCVQEERTFITLHGAELQASRAPVPQHAQFFGIVFKPSVFMSHLPAYQFLNNGIELPLGSNQSFWLNSAPLEIPNFENAETFVNRLVRTGVLVQQPVVASVLQGQIPDMSQRSMQRHFLKSIGINYRTMYQIERARRAALLLRQGKSILDVAYETGYYDQAYLSKSLKYFIGQTPAQLMNIRNSEQLSLLYKTEDFC